MTLIIVLIQAIQTAFFALTIWNGKNCKYQVLWINLWMLCFCLMTMSCTFVYSCRYSKLNSSVLSWVFEHSYTISFKEMYKRIGISPYVFCKFTFFVIISFSFTVSLSSLQVLSLKSTGVFKIWKVNFYLMD